MKLFLHYYHNIKKYVTVEIFFRKFKKFKCMITRYDTKLRLLLNYYDKTSMMV
jgi:hypothetical protein